MNVLDLFSGIGGFSLGLERAGMTTVAFCEIEPYPQAVLKKNFPGVPIYDDVRTVTAERLRADGIGTIDLICGGFPCQPFSVAGKQRGKEDHRHLWPEMFRIISEVKPTWVIGENVAGFVSMALYEVSADLESAGYEVQPFIIPACAAGAEHRRDRCWILAHSGYLCGRGWPKSGIKGFTPTQNDGEIISNANGERLERQFVSRKLDNSRYKTEWLNEFTESNSDVANAQRIRPQRSGQHDQSLCKKTGENGETNRFNYDCEGIGRDWDIEPQLGRVANGIPNRMDRLKALGNAVVPQIPEIIGRAIMAGKQIS